LQLTAFRDGVLFSASGTLGATTWWSGGTAATTTPLPGFAFGFSVVGDLAYYWSESGLGRTDGTPGGTLQLPLPSDVTEVQAVAPLAGRPLIIALSTGGHLSFLTSDGTPAGTVKLFDAPETASGGVPVRAVLSTGARVYLRVRDHFQHERIWASDGTPAGTGPLTPPSFLEHPLELAAVGSTVYFTAPAPQPPGRLALWKTDGTPAGTLPVYPATPPASPRFVDVDHLVAFAGTIWFFADDSGTYGLYSSDGTEAGTRAVKAVSPGAELAPTVAGNLLFFVGHGAASGDELWKTDGTAAGTALVKDILPGPDPSHPASLVAAGSTLFFTADDGRHGVELWQSDGTATGTRLADDVAPGTPSAQPQELTVSGNQLFFSADDGVHGRELWVYPLAGPACQPSPTALCLSGGRFRVEAAWRISREPGDSGPGQAVALSADTGYFWFFSPGNVEVVAKVLDGRPLNGHFWTFYGALSNVEYELTVTDTATGAARRYVNPPGTLASVGDTTSFGPQGAKDAFEVLPGPPTSATSAAALTSGRSTTAAAAPCVAGPTRLCLNGGRFGVSVAWQDFQNRTGVGTAVPLTSDTGYFWFFDPGNVETVVKVLGPVDGRFWVFYGALSSVAYILTVTDSLTGAVRTYQNPKGRLASVADTGAF
jgi:ELWxxDGT repeat protein